MPPKYRKLKQDKIKIKMSKKIFAEHGRMAHIP